jgi:hypothetical protein
MSVYLLGFNAGFKHRESNQVQQESGGTFYFRKGGMNYLLFDRANAHTKLRVRGDRGAYGRYRMTGVVTLVESEEYGINYICEAQGIYLQAVLPALPL